MVPIITCGGEDPMKTRNVLAVSAIAASIFEFANIAEAQNAGKLFIDGDMVRGAQRGAPGPVCVLNNQFKHLEKVVWRMRVRDADGKPLDDKGMQSVTVEGSNGQKVPAVYRPPPPNRPATDNFWSASWLIPAEYPNGPPPLKGTPPTPKRH